MRIVGWLCVLIGTLNLMNVFLGENGFLPMSVFAPVFWVTLIVGYFCFAKLKEKEIEKEKEKEKEVNKAALAYLLQQTAKVRPKTVQVAELHQQKTYWENYKSCNPTIASDIENLLNVNFSELSEIDVKEKIASVERLAKNLKCEISQIKSTYLAEIEKYPVELIPQIIEMTSRDLVKEVSTFHVSQDNTMSAMMITWLKERHEQFGKPSAKINDAFTEDEMEFVKRLNPYTTDVADLRERLKSLREMSVLFRCSMSELHDFYINDLRKNYDGKYENFHWLLDAFKDMVDKAYEVAPRVGLKPSNTSYGILCDWLFDFITEERKRFVDIGQVRCDMCGSHDIKLDLFTGYFVCNSCKREFGGI
ncbi:MAG: hypothetical protein J6U08_08060 [Paludibacteraceae bacterium]|nr:hypothetical protein [Paludibacteraceae bacterium]